MLNRQSLVKGLILVVYATLCRVEGGGSSCQDIDHDACVSMGKQNSQMCADTVLSNNACPAYCSNCREYCKIQIIDKTRVHLYKPVCLVNSI